MSFVGLVIKFLLYFAVPVAILLYWWINKKFSYWKDRNVPGPEPVWRKLAGNMFGVGTEVHFLTRMNEIYNEFKDKSPAVGIYMSVAPNILIIDPELAKTILVKDFAKFHDHGMYYNERDDPLSAHLFNLEGAKWRFFRNKLSPTFTSGKMKMMFSSIEQIGERFIEVLDKHAKDQSPVDAKDLSMRFTTDVVGSTAFGLEINCLGGESEVFVYAKRLFEAFDISKPLVLFKMTFHNLSRMLRLPMNPPDVSKFFMNMLEQTVDYREKNNIVRNDFLQMLLQLKNEGVLDGESSDGETEKMTFNQIAAQAFVFFFAGFETSSTAMDFTMLELALAQDIQDKARKEVNEKISKHGGKLSYEALMEMEYLNQVFSESLRLHPPVFALMRKANEDYTFPNSNMSIEKGTAVFVCSYVFHRDPQFFPNPDVFDPERFSKKNIESRHPFVYLPFGEGPRICIGNRFAQLQSRFALAVLLKNFRITLDKRTKLPMVYENTNSSLVIVGGTWLNVTRI